MNPKHTLGGAVALLLLGIGAFVLQRSAPVSSAPPAPAGATEATRSAPAPITPSAPPPSPTAPISATFGRPVSGQTLTVNSFGAGSRLRADLDRLDPAAQTRALAKLSQMTCGPQDADSLQVDRAGGVFYACKMQVPPAPRAATQATTAATGAPPPSAVPASQPPIRHSRPGAAKKIYLDFNGHQITGTAWNLASGTRPAVATYDCGAYDIDGAPGSFNDQEQADILEVWERVSEDFAPFDIDVTTEEPATFTSQTARALVTSKTDRNGVAMPSSDIGAGVAYLDVFGDTNYGYHSPALIYFDKLYSWAVYMAEAVSHEVGHNLALSHDGITEGDEYYAGHGSGETSWAPIMGASYYSNVTQWSKGEYTGANNPEDDLALIAARTGYAADDFGNNRASATPMSVSGLTLSANGCLGTTGDADVFSFTTSGGSCSFSAVPYRAPTGTNGGNADLKLVLLDSAGAPLSTGDPAASTAADLTATGLPPGTYFLEISAVGAGAPQGAPPTGYTSYASLGQYHITGQLTQLSRPIINLPRTGNGVFGWPLEFYVSASNPVATYGATGLPTGIFIDPSTGRISGTPLQAGTFNITLSATNAAGTGTAAFQLFIDTAPPVITTAPARRTMLAPGQSTTLSVAVTSLSGSPTYKWYHNGIEISGATQSTLDIGPATRATAGWYQTSVTDGYGTRPSGSGFILVAPAFTSVLGLGPDLPTLPAVENPIKIAIGRAHGLILQRDGKVRAWGDGAAGETSIPTDLVDVVDIAAGVDRSLVLRSDGSILAYGGDAVFRTVPASVQPAVAVALCGSTALAIRADGTIGYWGAAGHAPMMPYAGLVALETSEAHCLILDRYGRLDAWGSPTGETKVNTSYDQSLGIAAGSGISISITNQRGVEGWSAIPADYRITAIPSDLNATVQVSVGLQQVIAVQSDGSVRFWGDDTHGLIPTSVPPSLRFWNAAAGSRFTLLTREGAGPVPPYVVKSPSDQRCRIGDTASFTAIITGAPAPSLHWQSRVAGATDWQDIVESSHMHGVTTGTLSIVGVVAGDDLMQVRCVATNGADPAVSSEAGCFRLARAPVVNLTGRPRQVGTLGQPISLSVSVSGGGPFSYQWYRNGIAVSGADSATLALPMVLPENQGWYRVAVTNSAGTTFSHEYFLLCDGSDSVWNNSPYPVPPSLMNHPVSISFDSGNCLASLSDGTAVKCFGSNLSTLPNVTSAVAISSRAGAAVCLLEDGTLVEPAGFTSSWAVPPASLGGGIVQIANNGQNVLALRRDGTVVATRQNAFTTPVGNIPADLANVIAVAAGGTHGLALLSNGHVRAWGDNGSGQTNVPPDLTEVVAIAAGTQHSLALKADGTIVGWGGSAANGEAWPPANIGPVVAIAAGDGLSLAIQRDGHIVAWGAKYGFSNLPTAAIGIDCDVNGIYAATLIRTNLAPLILSNPADITIAEPAETQFNIVAIGSPALAYRWQRFPSGATIWQDVTATGAFSGHDSATLRIANADASLSGDQFRCVVTNGVTPNAVSSSARLTVRSTFAGFRQRHFAGVLGDLTISGPNADPDKDGMANLLEYAFALDPLINDGPSPVLFSMIGDRIDVTFRQYTQASDLTVTLQSSTDLQTWSDIPTDQITRTVNYLSQTTDQIKLRLIAPPSQRQFYRVAVAQH